MQPREVIWVGVNLNRSDNEWLPKKRLTEAHDAIVRRICESDLRLQGTHIEFQNGSCIDTYDLGPGKGTAVDIYDAMGTRIGFGIRVTRISSGKSRISKVRDWLAGLGIRLPVSVWVWSPATVPSCIVRRAVS